MAKFVDLHVFPRVDDMESVRKMAELLRIVGYSEVALSVPTGLMPDRISQLRRLFEEENVQTATRVDLSPSSRADLLKLLRRFRNVFDVVAVKCMNQAVAPIACRDRRVDIVFFDPRNQRVKFAHSMASLLKGALEVNVVSTFLGETRSEVFSRIVREAAVAREHQIRIVLSSGCSLPAMVRSPVQISAIATVIGLSKEQSSKGVSEIPCSIILANRERRSREYIEEGVKLVTPKAE